MGIAASYPTNVAHDAKSRPATPSSTPPSTPIGVPRSGTPLPRHPHLFSTSIATQSSDVHASWGTTNSGTRPLLDATPASAVHGHGSDGPPERRRQSLHAQLHPSDQNHRPVGEFGAVHGSAKIGDLQIRAACEKHRAEDYGPQPMRCLPSSPQLQIGPTDALPYPHRREAVQMQDLWAFIYHQGQSKNTHGGPSSQTCTENDAPMPRVS